MRILIGIFLLILCFGSNSCQKEFVISDVDSSLLTQTGDFTAKIDGAQFVADKATGATKAIGIIAITGQNVAGETIVLRVADSGVHVYTLDINSTTNVGVYTTGSTSSYSTNSGSTSTQSYGTMSITSIDAANRTLSGTFSMTLFNELNSTQKIVTEGVFNNIRFDTLATPPANSTDTFRVKVDGVDFPVFSVIGTTFSNMINLSANDQSVSKTVGLSFPSTISPGSYNFTLFNLDYVALYTADTSILNGDSGTLTILEHNTTTKRIKGNFNFHAAELLGTQAADLTEGYFSIVYQ